MTTIFNRGSGGTNGAAVTTANSGGTGETPFNAVQDLSNVVVNWSITNVDPDADLGILFQANASAGQASYVEWSTSLTGTPTAVAINAGASFVFPASPSVEVPIIRGTSSGTQRFRLTIGTTRFLVLRDSTNGQIGTSGVALVANQRYWIEVQVTGVDAPPGGTAEVRVYDSDNNLYTTIGPFSAQDLGGPIGEIRFGYGAAVTPPSTVTYYASRLAAGTDGWINPFGLVTAGVDLGPLVGGVTSAAAAASYKLTGADGEPTRLVVSTASNLATSPTYSSLGYVDADGIVKHSVSGLNPATQYHCGIEIGGVLQTDGRGQFKTMPVENSAASFCIAFGSSQSTGFDVDTFDTIRTYSGPQGAPLVWAHLGDYGTPQWATAVDQDTVRAHYEAQIGMTRLAALHAAMPWSYVPNDRDLAASPVNKTSVAIPGVAAAYRQLVPSHSLPAADGRGFFHAFTIGRVRFIQLDLWSQRDPAANADGSSKSMLGADQLAWFTTELQRAEPVKVVFSDVWRGEGSGTGRWGDYLYEFGVLNDRIDLYANGRVLIASGDRRALAADSGSAANTRGRPNVLASPFGDVSTQPFEAWSAGYWYSYQPTPVEESVGAFGVLEVQDTGGNSITVVYRGITSDGVQRVTHTQTFDLFEKRSLSGSVGPVGSAVKRTSRPTGGTVTPTSTLAKRSPRLFAGQVLPAGVARRLLARRLLASTTPAGGLLRRVGRPLAGSVAPSAALGSFWIARTLSGLVSPAGAVVRGLSRRLTGSSAPAGGVTNRSVGKTVAGAVAPAGSMSMIKSLLRAFASSVAVAGGWLRTTRQNRVGEVSPVASVALALARGLSGRVEPSGGLRKATERAESGSVAPAGTTTRTASLQLGGAILDLVGGLGRMLARRLSGEIVPAGTTTPEPELIARPDPEVTVMVDPLPVEVEVSW